MWSLLPGNINIKGLQPLSFVRNAKLPKKSSVPGTETNLHIQPRIRGLLTAINEVQQRSPAPDNLHMEENLQIELQKQLKREEIQCIIY